MFGKIKNTIRTRNLIPIPGIFLFISLFIAAIPVYFNILLTQNLIPSLITSLSILAAFLLISLSNLLIFMNIKQRPENKNISEIRLLKKICSDIFFCILCILTAILTIIILILISILTNRYSLLIYRIFTFMAYYSLTLFLSALFMLLKHIHALWCKENENQIKSRKVKESRD